jgi:hypothetical protein
VAGFHVFEEEKKDLRFEISEVRRLEEISTTDRGEGRWTVDLG